ncbi:MAG: hypothetical protein HY513_02685 [Candidatus Aenigmarchaeota archaeon]|nr:hypothetical protein [Candidatus Aenigmarchaeota archaeon]
MLQIQTSDPLNILGSTRRVLEQADNVKINIEAVEKLAADVKIFLGDNSHKYKSHKTGDNFDHDIARAFWQSVMGFCYWAEKGKEKWQVEWPKGNILAGGWYGVIACYDRALAEDIQVLNASWLMDIPEEDLRKIFRSATESEIPLFNERTEIMRNTAKILVEKFAGDPIFMLEKSEYDAVKLLQLLKEFPNFHDVPTYMNEKVVFLKLAHLVAGEFDRVLKSHGKGGLKNMDQICVFADYKLPQLLRAYGVLEYSQELADKVDDYELIPKESNEEIEIRAGTIWGVELIRQILNSHTSIELGQAIWLMSQSEELQKRIKPYHRTYTIFY